jgi:hypothetical protein
MRVPGWSAGGFLGEARRLAWLSAKISAPRCAFGAANRERVSWWRVGLQLLFWFLFLDSSRASILWFTDPACTTE